MKNLLLLCLLVVQIACMPQSGTLVSRDTGVRGSFTHQILISDHRHFRLMGHLIDVERNGVGVRALVIGQRSDGVNRFYATEAWYDGQRLPYRSTLRRSDGCTHGHCLDRPVGNIYLSDRRFAEALQNGLRARLVGSTGAIDVFVPASLFQAAEDL